jgi:hypothetical protein
VLNVHVHDIVALQRYYGLLLLLCLLLFQGVYIAGVERTFAIQGLDIDEDFVLGREFAMLVVRTIVVVVVVGDGGGHLGGDAVGVVGIVVVVRGRSDGG